VSTLPGYKFRLLNELRRQTGEHARGASRIALRMPSYNGGAMAERPGAVIDFGEFQQPLSPLFRDYLQGGGSVGGFMDDGFDLAATQAAAERAIQYDRPRAAVAEALVRQQRARQAERAAEAAARALETKSKSVATSAKSTETARTTK
jgi:hypothetical protein